MMTRVIAEDAKHPADTRAETQLDVRSCQGLDELELCVRCRSPPGAMTRWM